jgi:nicotinamide mononucleotide transporter
MPALSNAMLWLQQHYIEVAAVITGLLYMLYTIKENKLLWLFGIISSGLYSWVFYQSGIYAYAVLYLYYVVIGFYGWYNWSKKPASSLNDGGGLVVHRASKVYLWWCIALTGVLAIPIYCLLKNYTGSDLALADAVLTSGSIVATWMLTQKLIEQWLFWIIIDLLSFFVMIFKELYPSAILFLVYTLLAMKGYIEWKKELKTLAAK